MKEYLIETFKFNDWANKRALEKIKEMPEKDEAIRLFSHLITCMNKWMGWIKDDPAAPAMKWYGDIYPLEELGPRWDKCLNAWLDFLESHSEEEIDSEKRYVSGSGIKYGAKVKDMALQLNYHSIHHRAQLLMMMRMQGVQPPNSEYINQHYNQYS
jgi:uncharacterized damage-inducible protein DinB